MIRAIIAMFSLGWILPLWLSASFLKGWMHGELLPWLQGELPQANSHVALAESRLALGLACLWLFTVVIYWTWRLLHDAEPEPPHHHHSLSPK